MLIVVLIQLLFAVSYIFLKKLSFVEIPIFITGIRLIIAGIILLLISLAYNNKAIMFKSIKKEWKLILIAALFNDFFANALGQYSTKFLPASMICFINSLLPFATAIICFLFFNEKLSRLKWIGLACGFIGFIPNLLIGDSISFDCIKQNLASEIFVLFAMISSAIGWIVIRKLTKEKKINEIIINGTTLFLGGIIALINSFIFEKNLADSLYNPKIWIFNFLIAVNTYVICYTLYSYALKKYTATFLAFTGFLSTIFTSILGYIFIGEKISNLFILSVIIMTVGLFIFYTGEKRKIQKLNFPDTMK